MAPKKLLVADDSLTIQKVIRLALSNEGYEIQAVSNGKDAMEQISLFRPDVILIDVSLPGKSAFEVKEEFNQEFTDLGAQFVLMSSAFEQLDENKAEEVGFAGRLVKPFDPAHLRQVLVDVLNLDLGESREEPSTDDDSTEPSIALSPPDPDEWSLDDSDGDFLDENGGVAEEPPSRSSDFIQPPAPPKSAVAAYAPPPGKPEPAEPEDEESTLIVQPPEELSGDLWSEENSGNEGPDEIGTGGEEDIKELTESTIRMSGLDDYQWSVNESAKLPGIQTDHEPGGETLGPDDFPRFTDGPGEVGDVTLGSLQYTEPTLPPLPNMMDTGGVNYPSGDIASDEAPDNAEWTPQRKHLSAASATPEEPDDSGVTGFDDLSDDASYYHNAPERNVTDSAPYEANARSGGDVVPVSTAEVEELIHQRVQEAIREMAQKLIPEIAERIVREEIDKLLSDPPA